MGKKKNREGKSTKERQGFVVRVRLECARGQISCQDQTPYLCFLKSSISYPTFHFLFFWFLFSTLTYFNFNKSYVTLSTWHIFFPFCYSLFGCGEGVWFVWHARIPSIYFVSYFLFPTKPELGRACYDNYNLFKFKFIQPYSLGNWS